MIMDLSHKVEKKRKRLLSVTYTYTLDHTYDQCTPYWRKNNEPTLIKDNSKGQDGQKNLHVQFYLPSVYEEVSHQVVGEKNKMDEPKYLSDSVTDTAMSYLTIRRRRLCSESDGEGYLMLPQVDVSNFSSLGRLQRSKSVIEKRCNLSPQGAMIKGESLEEWRGSERMLHRRNASTSEEVKGSVTNLKRKLRTESMYDWLLD